MSSERSQGSRGRDPIEWIGGTVPLPANLSGESEPLEVLFWIAPDGEILGSTVATPGELLPMASEHLQSTIERPMCGVTPPPTRVRVASAELADVLRTGHPGLDVVCGPTPELDEVQAKFGERMAGMEQETFLFPEVSPEATAAFFKAAAHLFQDAPWAVVPDDETAFSVTIEQLGVHDAVLSVAGQTGEHCGLRLFATLDDFEGFLDATGTLSLDEVADLPPHLLLVFETVAGISAAAREEVSEHQWQVASDDAYPVLIAAQEQGSDRAPTAEEVAIAEALALSLPRVTAEEEALWDAWDGLQPLSRSVSVSTYAGEVEVVLATPYSKRRPKFDPSHDILADLAALSRDVYEIDHDARQDLEDELVGRFITSPEGKALHETFACRFVMELAANHVGQTIATLDAEDLGEVLFNVIPRKVSVAPSEALDIVEQLRAFYRFLKRELELEHADPCLKLLGGDAVERLEAALSDSANYGMAKSMVMAGADAGYDMGTQEGIESWMRLMEDEPLPSVMSTPGRPKPISKKAAQAKKNKRKAARKARKKNR